MIKLIGGLSAMRFEPLLFTKMAWMLLALDGSVPGFDHTIDSEQGVLELKALLRLRRRSHLKSLPASLHEEDALAEDPVFLALHRAGLLGRILRESFPRNDPGQETQELPGAQDSCRMAIILFLSAAAENYGQDSEEAKFYLHSLQVHLEGRSDDSYLAPAHLLWAMLRLSFLNRAKEKCIDIWISVVRMTSAWKALDGTEREQFRADFLASLTYDGEEDNSPHAGSAPLTQPHRPEPAMRFAPAEVHCELMWFTVAD
jgi:hypothetical protein